MSQWLTLARAIEDPNSSKTKRTRAAKHKSYKTWDSYEYVGFETPEGWGAK